MPCCLLLLLINILTREPSLTSYSQPSSVTGRTKVSPYPATWADSSPRGVLGPTGTSSLTASTLETKHSHGTPIGAVVGGVIGGVADIIIAILVTLTRPKKRSPNNTTEIGCLQTTELAGATFLMSLMALQDELS